MNSNTVLSAAHCFDDPSRAPTHVLAGDTDLRSSSDGNGVQQRIASVTQHPQWNSRTLANDITVIKLPQSLSYSRTIRWACLPDPYQGQNLTFLLSNSDPYVIGWGSTRVGGGPESKLRQVQVPMVSQSNCASAYSNVGQVSIDDTKMCAGLGGKDSCNGDSGGALLSEQLQNVWSVLGVVSFGVDCARPDFPGVYTRVDQYLGWIRQQM